ncbi:hypothetical protein [Cylindrospermum stagnale]|uniref:hypothetical protein n=1 Tax=Cylindrospermum stagnale TaxID=142864 RepID=UPI00059E733F|nr:hypothetical protein [Cylindrospermum stagnale]
MSTAPTALLHYSDFQVNRPRGRGTALLIGVNLTLKPGNGGITTFTQLPINPEEPHPGFAGAKPPLPS